MRSCSSSSASRSFDRIRLAVGMQGAGQLAVHLAQRLGGPLRLGLAPLLRRRLAPGRCLGAARLGRLLLPAEMLIEAVEQLLFGHEVLVLPQLGAAHRFGHALEGLQLLALGVVEVHACVAGEQRLQLGIVRLRREHRAGHFGQQLAARFVVGAQLRLQRRQLPLIRLPELRDRLLPGPQGGAGLLDLPQQGVEAFLLRRQRGAAGRSDLELLRSGHDLRHFPC
jgi:hypothetical protein